eukprot:TRINITY_DN1706_c0_g1_i1.p1 TRINITY_DN1706_c0_g1~~TRINITY_DN1706_c0_g1_i1.p1  ORF type:complete len:343 (+),score=-6.22 TRINITY_DN1706_c0_g1_i1:137-1165(+)
MELRGERRNLSILGIALLMITATKIVSAQAQGLKVGFYNETCPQAEQIIRDAVVRNVTSDKSVTPALLRMHFHDCFVRGCDASILIDDQNGTTDQVEKDAGPNLSVRGFELIDEIKSLLEEECPATVSCADIIALAARDSVVLAGGEHYSLPTGRRDGRISNISEVNIPSPSSSVPDAADAFSTLGLNLSDMVTLLGAHTVGVAKCSFFSDRLYDFEGTGKADPTMDPTLVTTLKKVCPNPSSGNSSDPTVFLDQNSTSSFVFDNSYYGQLKLHRGILQIDQELWTNSSTKSLVGAYASDGNRFDSTFGSAMIKLGNASVLTGTKGEIRLKCRVVNPSKKLK